MIRTFGSRQELLDWVVDHTDPSLPLADCDRIAEVICAMDHPRYGADWSGFLASLPEFADLIEA